MLWVPLNMGMSAAHCLGYVREFQSVWRVVTVLVTWHNALKWFASSFAVQHNWTELNCIDIFQFSSVLLLSTCLKSSVKSWCNVCIFCLLYIVGCYYHYMYVRFCLCWLLTHTCCYISSTAHSFGDLSNSINHCDVIVLLAILFLPAPCNINGTVNAIVCCLSVCPSVRLV